ncbi:lipid-A-disaccharide synthase [Pseudanabaena sp. UWO311]|uniref:lipid-A-disaccharide synthase n=1 Tax=Pseudanabaena sp. UWO311 TaxID=2487337 RepID=UPI0016816A25|nr:lipid-A-disaccharide synthase [Pseudanabaena sp. UWO311]
MKSSSETKIKRRVFISTGEVSGDWHGAILIEGLRERAALRGIELEIVGLGGDRMAATGIKVLGNTVGIGSIGIVEALPYVLPTLKVQRDAKQWLKTAPPDVVVLIDYMMPNQSMGHYAKHTLKIPVIYYIAPQEWVWSYNDKNTRAIADFTDKLLAIFPQEAIFYEKQGTNVQWVGHPFVDLMARIPDRMEARKQLGIADDDLVVTLLPASRTQELRSVMPIILAAAKIIQTKLPHVKFWLPLSLERYRPEVEKLLEEYDIKATIISAKSQIAISAADLVLSKSGTVNLETALLNVPQVILYRVSNVTAWIARHVLKLKLPFISPVNLVNMESVVPEFVQTDAIPEAIAECALDLLINPQARQTMLDGYSRVRESLGEKGAINRVADSILDYL